MMTRAELREAREDIRDEIEEIDAIHYEISDPREAARLEALAREAEIDRHDAPTPGEAKWITLMWSGSLPPAATPTDDELGQLAAFGCI